MHRPVHAGHGAHRQACDQREGDDGLRDDHGGGREQPAKRPEGAGPREQQVDDQADDDRRQSHAGVEGERDEPLAAEPDEPEKRAQRHTDPVAMSSATPVTRSVRPTMVSSSGRTKSLRALTVTVVVKRAVCELRRHRAGLPHDAMVFTQCEYRPANSSGPTTSWMRPSRPVIGLPSRS